MKKFKTLIISCITVIALITVSVVSYAQNAPEKQSAKEAVKTDSVKVPKFVTGRVLSESDLGFLNSLNDTKATKKGNKTAKKEVTINNKKYAAKYKLTKDDAQAISDKIVAYADTHKLEKVKDTSTNGFAEGRPIWCRWVRTCDYDFYGDWICWTYWCCN